MRALNLQAQKKASVTGIVVDENGTPIIGANVTLLSFDGGVFKKRVTTDATGRFYASVDGEGSYLVYVTYDDKKTPGVDYVPERWRTWLSSDSTSSRQFILKKGASIYLDGEIRYVKTNKPATSYRFTILELKGTTDQNYWTGPVREYGSFSDLVRIVNFNERLAVVPAETEVKIQLIAYFPGKQSQTFILTGKSGYFKLSQGEVLHINVREHNILSNVKYVKEVLNSCFSLLYDCRIAGFLVEAERRDLLNAYDAVEESLLLLRKGFFDQSFANVRRAYILATKDEETLKGLIQISSQSLLPSLFLFVSIAFASAYLISEKYSCLEITAGNREFSISITSLINIALYALLVTLFYLVFPGCRLIPQSTFVTMSILAFLTGKAIKLLSSWLAYREKGGSQQIQFKSAIVVALSMATRNLRRRKMRTAINLISFMTLVFGFIVLTSISTEYGLLAKELKPALPIDALLIKEIPLDALPGTFVNLPNSFIEWLESRPKVTLVSPKAENIMVDINNPLGRLYSPSGKWIYVRGIIGIIPNKEANITGLKSIVNKGEYLEDDDLEGILVSSSLQDSLDVDIGDKLYGFGKAFIIRGFFDKEAISKLVDVDGQTFLPYNLIQSPSSPPVSSPCLSDSVIILNYETALTLPNVFTSRVVVQLSDIKSYESLAKIIAMTYEYQVYVSHPGSLILNLLTEYTEAHGVECVPLLMCLVMLNVAASMFAMVDERRNEIATLSSVGLNPTHIASLLVAEALIISFIGGGVGYLLGISGYRFAFFLGGLQVREKVSIEWGLLSIFLSILTAFFASLIPALSSSTLVTPSLLRRWTVRENENSRERAVFDLPIKLSTRELEQFTVFVVKRLREDASFTVDKINLKEEPFENEVQKKISFEYYPVEKVGGTKNELIIRPVGRNYTLKLICTPHDLAPRPRDIIHATITYVRKITLEWTAATSKVIALLDPYMTRLYNLVNTYNPTTLYVISTLPDSHEKIETFRKVLFLRGIRPPMFNITYIDPQNLEPTMKTLKELVSKADIICVSGEHAVISAALAIEAVKQNKIICCVIDNRPIEERMKNPFQDLKIVFLS